MLVRTEERQYARDTDNHALLTTDRQALHRARAQRAAVKRGRETHNELMVLREQVAALQAFIEKMTNL